MPLFEISIARNAQQHLASLNSLKRTGKTGRERGRVRRFNLSFTANKRVNSERQPWYQCQNDSEEIIIATVPRRNVITTTASPWKPGIIESARGVERARRGATNSRARYRSVSGLNLLFERLR